MWILKNGTRYISRFAFDIFDAFPPYKYAEGLLEGKEYLDEEGRYVISVASARVEVDGFTFDNLMIGEQVKVRLTRAGRAVNIDRIVPRQGPI